LVKCCGTELLRWLRAPPSGLPIELDGINWGQSVAVASTAEAAGLARVEMTDPIQQVHWAMWRPEYPAWRLSRYDHVQSDARANSC
jgi:hypothetical protein